MKPKVGDTYKYNFTFTQEDVIKFADVVKDHNPIHLDEDFAAKSPYKKPVIHGHLCSSVFTRFLSVDPPGGPGSIYVKQLTEYKRPMFVDKSYEIVFEILSIDHNRHMAEIAADIVDIETKKVTIAGVGTVLNTDLY